MGLLSLLVDIIPSRALLRYMNGVGARVQSLCYRVEGHQILTIDTINMYTLSRYK